MGLGPSIKMTTLHHYQCPVTKALLQETAVDFAGIIVNGVSERYDDKVFTAARTGDIAACMGADGAIVEIDGWGNHHIDFVSVIEQLGKRGIPAVGLSYIGLQGRLVCTNDYVDTIIDFNKNESGYESCIVGDNNVDAYDAAKAVALMKLQMKRRGIRLQPAAALQGARLLRKTYAVHDVRMGTSTELSQGVLTIDGTGLAQLIDKEARLRHMTVQVVRPQERHRFVNSNLDFMPIACKTEGALGQGETRLLTGVTVMVTGAEAVSGFQPGNIGSSQGFLDEQVKFGQAGTPREDDLILHIDFQFEDGEGRTAEGIRAAHAVADRVVDDIRQVLKAVPDEADEVEEFYDRKRPGSPRVILVKVVSGLGNMYETALFPREPAGLMGARYLMDTQNTPFAITPDQCLDGAIHSLL